MKRLLWITDEPPDRGRGGGSIRQAHLLSEVARHFEVVLLTASDVKDPQVLSEVTQLVRVDAGARRGGRARRLLSRYPTDVASAAPIRAALAAAAARLEPTVDIVLVEHAWILPILPRLRRVPWVGTLHYLPSSRAQQWATVADSRLRRLLRDRDVRRAHRLESWAVASYDRILAVSEPDALALGDAGVVPNGVDLEAFPATPVPTEPRVVMTASLNYGPNIDGLRWFLADVWPLVAEHRPDAVLEIVGRQPSDEVVQLVAKAGAQLHADVPAVAPHLARARVAVVPLRIGSGTRLKALEAMSAGRPMVGTTIGLEGLHLTHGVDCFMVDEADTSAAAILELLEDHDLASRLAGAARQLADARFGWPHIGSQLVRELERALETRP